MSEITATDPNLIRIEEEVRRFWQWYRVQEVARTGSMGGVPYRLIQEPLPVASRAWRDQVRLLTTADLMARYQTLRGRAVAHETAWSCHGLPIEVAVESMLHSVPQVYGIDRFSAACQQAAADGLHLGEGWAERLAAWLDPDLTVSSMQPEAVLAVWSVVRRLWDMGRLRQEQTVVNVCRRCATPLSPAEKSRRERRVDVREIWVRLPWDGEPDTYFLTWTPAPWMLLGMVAVAVHPEADYVVVEQSEGSGQAPTQLVLAEALVGQALSGHYRVLRHLTSKALRGSHYRPLFTFMPSEKGVSPVVQSTEVPRDRGTGVWPVTPGFDGTSLLVAQAHSLQAPDLLDDRGNLADSVTPWRGLGPLDAEAYVVEDLRARGLVHREVPIKRDLAECPYCGTVLLPQARRVWQAEMGGGKRIIGRDRAWGTPLPVWKCEECAAETCVAGADDLAHRAGVDAASLDLHRPAVDRLAFPCTACGGLMRRTPAVLDATFEMAALSLALVPQAGPADLAVGLDTGEDWRAALCDAAALLAEEPAWKQSLVLPAQEDDGDWDPSHNSPSDALRWATYANTTPIRAERAFIRPLWRLLVGLASPAGAGLASPSESTVLSTAHQAARKELRRWLRARILQAIQMTGDALQAADPLRASQVLASLVEEASGWHLSTGFAGDREVLEVACSLVAPFVPHLAEAICRQAGLRGGESVHLGTWPPLNAAWEDPEALAQIDLVRRLADLGRAIRTSADVPAEPLLPRAAIGLTAEEAERFVESAGLQALLARALLVRTIEIVQDLPAQTEWHVTLTSRSARGGAIDTAELQAALSSLTRSAATEMVHKLWARYSVGVEVHGRMATVLPDEALVELQAAPGWIAGTEPGRVVALEIGRVAEVAPLE